MIKVLEERSEYQRFIIDYLVNENKYIERKNSNFDRNFAMDKELLFKFLWNTQEEIMEELKAIYKNDLEEMLVNYINNEITKKRSSLIDVLKHGLEISNKKIELMFTKPTTTFNKKLNKQYEGNIFSVMEEVVPRENERVDLVIFLNGLAIISFELKSDFQGQTYKDAIRQYRRDRNPNSRFFLWKAGCIVNFAMDTNEVHMTTKLEKEKTFFLPFNKGNGSGVNTGAGNPIHPDKYSVYYMWEDILKKDTILELIKKFIYIEKKENVNETSGKTTVKETVIFPRFHQLDLIRKLLADVKENKTKLNYLIQHSAGSGKTNSIAWLAHRLASFHDDQNNIIYDTIIIITDRVVVDRQLQNAVLQLDHQHGLIKAMGDDATSQDLKKALESNTKIIATTIQKFPYIASELKNLKQKTFAVIIDEAHSSTSGKNMLAVTKSLSSDENEEEIQTVDDYFTEHVAKAGKQQNVSMFAFTATPKASTLRMFGRENKQGHYQAFHLYSMKQAIEEGFILDVLSNFTTYETMCKINKTIEGDPEIETSDAKRQITKFIELHDVNIRQRIEVIIEHFRLNVMDELGGNAKAMVITSSRAGAVKYKKAFENYIKSRGYNNIHALVAFSGKVKLKDDPETYTEVGMNKGLPESNVPTAFNSKDYNVLIVANKYQTGFDQKKLSAMYIMKKLDGVNAVQTLSRLNRICPPYDKKVFVLDFENDYKTIENAFEPYYTTTLLANDLTPRHIYDINASIDGFSIIDQIDVDKINDLIFKKSKNKITDSEAKTLLTILNRTCKTMEKFPEEKQIKFVRTMRSFKRFYEYLIQVSCFADKNIHKKYVFISCFLNRVDISSSGGGFDLRGKIDATHFQQRKTATHIKEAKTADPIIKLSVADEFSLAEKEMKKLSEIIDEINLKTGKNYNVDVAVKAVYQIRDILLKKDELKKSAKVNKKKDFKLSYFSSVEDALIEGLDQNKEFFSLLLKNKEMREEVLGIFLNDIYKNLGGNSNG